MGNMILIKDRHSLLLPLSGVFHEWGNMILIKDRHAYGLESHLSNENIGKYDTYKGSTHGFPIPM